MTLRLFNSLDGKLSELRPLEPGKIGMYHCGPTVKEPIDLGKFRSYLVADILRRHLERSGFEVTQVMNITDVGHLNEYEEDAVEVAAARSGLYAWELVEQEAARFHEERRALNIRDATHYPTARDHIGDMIELVEALESQDVCYRSGGNVYLDIEKVQNFGRLSEKSLGELEDLAKESAKTRPDEAANGGKRNPLDIDMWRTNTLHQMCWDSPWGRGFPGWHVECAAMSRRYLGGSFDIHTGTHENAFPHHDCEMAQVETLTGKPLASVWLHSGPVMVDGLEMSRANDNLVSVRELLQAGFSGSVLRLALLSRPYRSAVDFTDPAREWARGIVGIVLGFDEHLEELIAGGAVAGEDAEAAPWILETDQAFQAALDDDLNFPRAADAVRVALEKLEPEDVGNPHNARAALTSWNDVLGIA